MFLADAEQQAGLTGAAERINAIRTELSAICPYTIMVNIAGRNQVQVARDGQASLFPLPSNVTLYPVSADGEREVAERSGTFQTKEQMELAGLLADFVLSPLDSGKASMAGGNGAKATKPILSGNKSFSLKSDIPRVFQTERLPLSTDDLLDCIGKRVAIDDSKFMEGLREAVNITRREESLFDGSVGHSAMLARLERERIAQQAQRALFEPDGYLHPRELIATLMKRMRRECGARGIVKSDEELRYALDLISVRFPGLVRWAARECAAYFKELHDTLPLAESLELPVSTAKSRLNVYGVIPPDLNQDERAFAELLDADLTDTVEWWHRNESGKPWSIGLVLPSGKQYFPDFMVKVKKRTRGNGLLLVEIKGSHILNDPGTLDKAIAEHKLYKAPLMLVRDRDGRRFMTVKFNEKSDKNQLDQVFYIENLGQY